MSGELRFGYLNTLMALLVEYFIMALALFAGPVLVVYEDLRMEYS